MDTISPKFMIDKIIVSKKEDGTTYVYHPLNNKLFKVDNNKDNDIKRIKKPNQASENIMKSPPFPIFSFLPMDENDTCNRSQQRIIICLTHQCNFRCDYCIYGGNYREHGYRYHSNDSITFEIAALALIDILNDSLKCKRSLNFCFYGGEPLLEKALLTDIVNFIESNFNDIDYNYTITTNGSLLDTLTIEFLIKHNFFTYISIDGHPDNHNKHRKTVSGIDTFDDIFYNIKNIYLQNPAYFINNVYYNLTYNADTDFYQLISFLSENQTYFPPSKIILSSVLKSNGSLFGDTNLTLSEIVVRSVDRLTGNKFKTQDMSDKEKYELEIGKKILFPKLSFLYNNLSVKKICNGFVHLNGCCVPGKDVLFVDIDGKYYYCQSITSYGNCIGDAFKGVDNSLIKGIVNKYQSKMLEKCRKCWAVSLCRQCYFTVDINNESVNIDTICDNYRLILLSDLKLYCKVYERDKYFYNKCTDM